MNSPSLEGRLLLQVCSSSFTIKMDRQLPPMVRKLGQNTSEVLQNWSSYAKLINFFHMDAKLPLRLLYSQVGLFFTPSHSQHLPVIHWQEDFTVTCCSSHNSRSFFSHFALLTKSEILLLVPLENPSVKKKKKKISLECE